MPKSTTSSSNLGVGRKAPTLRVALMATVLAAGLAACGEKAASTTPGTQLDSAIAKTEDAAATAARKAAELAETARDKTTAYINSPQAKQDAAAVKDGLKNAGTALKATAEEASITASVSAALARDAALSATRIDVDTTGTVVRLSGPAPSAEAKSRATELAKSVAGVSAVDNQLAVSASAQ